MKTNSDYQGIQGEKDEGQVNTIRSSRATLLLTSLKMLWSTQDRADTCFSYIGDRYIKNCMSKLCSSQKIHFWVAVVSVSVCLWVGFTVLRVGVRPTERV